MRDISSTVTGYKSMTTSLIIGFAAAMLFIAGLFLANYAKLTDIQSKVAVIPSTAGRHDSCEREVGNLV